MEQRIKIKAPSTIQRPGKLVLPTGEHVDIDGNGVAIIPAQFLSSYLPSGWTVIEE